MYFLTSEVLVYEFRNDFKTYKSIVILTKLNTQHAQVIIGIIATGTILKSNKGSQSKMMIKLKFSKQKNSYNSCFDQETVKTIYLQKVSLKNEKTELVKNGLEVSKTNQLINPIY